jgi:hypothetical protein
VDLQTSGDRGGSGGLWRALVEGHPSSCDTLLEQAADVVKRVFFVVWHGVGGSGLWVWEWRSRGRVRVLCVVWGWGVVERQSK